MLASRKMKVWTALLTVLLITVLWSQSPSEFKKENRSEIIAFLLKDITENTGGTTAMSDSGSGKITSDMDVTCKLVLERPDSTIDNDLAPRFMETAKRLYPTCDFKMEKFGSVESKILDTAVHDARNAVPDFRTALPLEQFKVKYIQALEKKSNNPEAYFTSGGNKKQVEFRMQTKSRLRVFKKDKKTGAISDDTVVLDRSKTKEYNSVMWKV